MSLRRRFWNGQYRETPSWELGTPDPVLFEALDRTGPHDGRAIDLGCGTGDNAIELARRGFEVTAIDVADRPLSVARAKAAEAGVEVDLRVADVSHLAGIDGPFDLVVDRGLMMSLFGARARRAYARTVARLTGPGGHVYTHQWLLPGTAPPQLRARLATRLHGVVLVEGELEQHLGETFDIEQVDRELVAVEDPGMRRLGITEVAATSWWLTRTTSAG